MDGMMVPQLVNRWNSMWTSHIAKPIGTSVMVYRMVTCLKLAVVRERECEAVPASGSSTRGTSTIPARSEIEVIHHEEDHPMPAATSSCS